MKLKLLKCIASCKAPSLQDDFIIFFFLVELNILQRHFINIDICLVLLRSIKNQMQFINQTTICVIISFEAFFLIIYFMNKTNR